MTGRRSKPRWNVGFEEPPVGRTTFGCPKKVANRQVGASEFHHEIRPGRVAAAQKQDRGDGGGQDED
jgi:hypothetical protein